MWLYVLMSPWVSQEFAIQSSKRWQWRMLAAWLWRTKEICSVCRFWVLGSAALSLTRPETLQSRPALFQIMGVIAFCLQFLLVLCWHCKDCKHLSQMTFCYKTLLGYWNWKRKVKNSFLQWHKISQELVLRCKTYLLSPQLAASWNVTLIFHSCYYDGNLMWEYQTRK